MALEKLKRWHWMTLGVLLGLTVSQVRNTAGPFAQGAFADPMNNPHEFEQSLAGTAGKSFKDLAVYPVRIDDDGGRKKLVHVVTGKHYDGSPTAGPDGSLVAVWRPRSYIASFPYRPVAQLANDATPGYAVTDYMEERAGVSYRYAWWCDPVWSTAVWTAGGVVVVGVVWPTVINLLVFGKFLRPRDEKGIDLGKVKTAEPSTAEPAEVGMDAAALARLEAELEADDLASADAPAAVTPQPVRALVTTRVADAAAPPQPDKAFDAGPEDYYPTELHAGPGRRKTG